MQFAVSEFPQIVREVVRTGIARFDAQAFPFLSRRSEDAAEAAECAADQGAYWPYRERLLDQEHGLRAGADLIDTAAGIGLDVQVFRRCIENDTYADEVAAQIQGGRDRGVSGTPTVLVDGRKVSWGADTVIDTVRRAAQSRPVALSGYVGDSGGPLAGVTVTASDGTSDRTAPDGSFAITLGVSGAYLLEASVDGCRVYYHQLTGATGSRNSATPIQVSDEDISDIRIEIPADVCALQIRGRLVDASGAALADVQVEADGNNRSFGVARTASDGSFAIPAPMNDHYRLSFWDGCWVFRGEGGGVTTSWDDASLIRVAGDDVSGVVFRVPDNPCG